VAAEQALGENPMGRYKQQIRISLILLFLLLIARDSYSQWSRQDTTNTDGLYKIFFVDSTYGFAGGNGFILKTTDGGLNWTRKSLFGEVNLLYFLGKDTGFCATNTAGGYPYTHNLYRTTNGGIVWQTVDSGSFELYSMTFINSSMGLVVGTANGQSVILKTTNGGTNWSQNIYPSGTYFGSIVMLNNQIGFIAGGAPEKIWKTTDSGNSWFITFTSADLRGFILNKIIFSDSLHGFACGQNFYKTSDGGNTWINITFPVDNHISVSAHANKCWLLSNGESKNVLYSSDYGESWVPILKIFNQRYMMDIFFTDSQNGWIAGSDGFLLKTTNGGFSSIPIPNQPELYSPINDTLLNTNTVIFNWSEDNFAFHRIQISQNSLFNVITTDQIYLDNIIRINNFQPYTHNFWRVRSENIIGNSYWSNIASFEIGNVVGVREIESVVRDFHLFQNYPNPFNPSTIIKFNIPYKGLVTIKMYDVLGRETAHLLGKQLPQGENTIIWNAENYPSGIYFCKVQYSSMIKTMKLLLLR